MVSGASGAQGALLVVSAVEWRPAGKRAEHVKIAQLCRSQ